ncbi:MAG: GntR family transcriptional regulator [Treponema sp.]|nr:GntR family transcriptional regulator [Treponema sp.]
MISFTKDITSKIKLYHQLYERFSEEIKNGSLKPDSKLPSIRQVSEEFEISKNTVTKAYNLLEKNGFIHSEEKRGYFVNSISESAQETKAPTETAKTEPEDNSIPTVESILKQRRPVLLSDDMPPAPADLSSVIADSISVVAKQSVPEEEPVEEPEEKPEENSVPTPQSTQSIEQPSVTVPEEKSEPEPETPPSVQTLIAQICTHVLKDTQTEPAREPFGEKSFREAIAKFLKSHLNIQTSPEQIVVASDSRHLLKSILALQTIREPFEKSNGMGLLKLADKLSSGSATPVKAQTGLAEGTDENTKMIFTKSKLPYREIPYDELGLNPQDIHNSESTSIFIVPGDLKPLTTGDCKERIWQILDWAYQISYRHIIEYDTSPLLSEPERIRIKSSDLRSKVIYINSFENLLWGGLKAAFAVLPSSVCADYKQYYDYLPCPLSLLEQRILTEFINNGSLEQIKRG